MSNCNECRRHAVCTCPHLSQPIVTMIYQCRQGAPCCASAGAARGSQQKPGPQRRRRTVVSACARKERAQGPCIHSRHTRPAHDTEQGLELGRFPCQKMRSPQGKFARHGGQPGAPPSAAHRQATHATYTAMMMQRAYAQSAWKREHTLRGNQLPHTVTLNGPFSVSSKQRLRSWCAVYMSTCAPGVRRRGTSALQDQVHVR